MEHVRGNRASPDYSCDQKSGDGLAVRLRFNFYRAINLLDFLFRLESLEPTLGILRNGRVLMVLRGSNDVRPELPGTKWFVTSCDGGCSWSNPTPWTYTDGEAFFSPSACSQLLKHSSGRLFWLGNIAPQNPRGNSPRYPLVIGEVDCDSGLLKRDSVFAIDDRRPGDHESMHLSNFYAREDRETGDVILHCSRLFANRQPDTPLDWTADALVYRIAVAPAS
jgi:hypothetical protein